MDAEISACFKQTRKTEGENAKTRIMVEAKTRTYTEFKRVKHNRNLTEPGFSATSGVIVVYNRP